MILNLFGFLVDPTDQYLSEFHKSFSHGFVWLITNIVGCVTPLAFVAVSVFLLGQTILLPPVSGYSQFVIEHWLVTFPLGIWFVVEIGWYFYCWNLRRRFGVPRSFPGLTQKQREDYLDKVLDHCPDPLSSLVGWFYQTNPDHVGFECIEEWLSWAFFSKDFQHLSSVEVEELRTLVDRVVAKCPEAGRPSAEHVKYQLKFMRLHFDKMIVQHKPFIAYVVISIMQIGGSWYLEWRGFKHHSLPGNSSLSYWSYRCPRLANLTKEHNHTQANSDLRPIFIVHGIGIGVAMYVNVIKAIVAKDPARPIFILELPHISLKVVSSVATMEDTIAAVDEIYRRHKLTDQKCSWLAHSYGTIVSAWILKERPEYVDKICFVDPVCFALWEPDLIYNFLYRRPLAPIHRVCQFFVGQDMLVAYTLFRNFWWLQNILFPEDIQCPASVFVSSHDFIIDADFTYKYLKRQVEINQNVKDPKDGQEFEVVKMQGMSHGSFLNSREHTDEIVSRL